MKKPKRKVYQYKEDIDIDKKIYFASNTFEPWHVISNNVAFFLQMWTHTSLCSLLLSLETPNDVRLVA